MSKPNDGEQLFVYLAVSEVGSAVLIWEEEGRQYPIYYASKMLSGAESRYPHLEKLALALVTDSLRQYF